uniref:Uncharacterized protein n=1 Tax=Ditylenchus dipsaci TaxID=166011 RepID=A0A915DTI4_9BILA
MMTGRTVSNRLDKFMKFLVLGSRPDPRFIPVPWLGSGCSLEKFASKAQNGQQEGLQAEWKRCDEGRKKWIHYYDMAFLNSHLEERTEHTSSMAATEITLDENDSEETSSG